MRSTATPGNRLFSALPPGAGSVHVKGLARLPHCVCANVSFGSIALLQSFEQRPLDSFFASAGIADARTSASEISARRARRHATSAVPWNQSFRMSRYERMNGCSWPTAAVPYVRRKRVLEESGSCREGQLTGLVANSRNRPFLDVHALGSRRRLRPDSSRSRHCSASRTPDRSPQSRLSVSGGNEREERRQRQLVMATNRRNRPVGDFRALKERTLRRARARALQGSA